MPEGDTIFRTARALGRALAGKPVTVFRSTYPLLTRFNDDTPITGQLVAASKPAANGFSFISPAAQRSLLICS